MSKDYEKDMFVILPEGFKLLYKITAEDKTDNVGNQALWAAKEN